MFFSMSLLLSGKVFVRPARVNMNCRVAASNRASLTDAFSCLGCPPLPFLLE
jgi:hypothetical protein